MGKTRITQILSLLGVTAAITGCHQPPEYRLIRPAKTVDGDIQEPALYERVGDKDHVYMQALGSTNLIRMKK